MKVKLTKKLDGKIKGNVGDVVEVDDHFAQAIIRQGAAIKEQPKPKEEKKEKQAP